MAQDLFKLGKDTGRLLVKFDGDAEFTRFASVRGLTVIVDNTDETEVRSDDEGTLLKFTDQVVRVECDYLKVFDAEIFAKLQGTTVTVNNGALVAGAEQVLTSGEWALNTFIPITNQNADGSAITINSVTGATDGALTANDDYDLVVLDDGTYGLVFQDVASATNLTTAAQDVTIDYDYTPAASKQVSITTGSGEKVNVEVRVEAIRTDGKERYFNLSSATLSSEYNFGFVDVQENGDVAVSNMVFESNDNATFLYHDEVLSDS